VKPATPLQPLIDQFVREFGGEIVADLIGNLNPPRNADYFFRADRVIAELKSLERDTFGESFRQKIGALMADWQRRRLLLVYGMTQVQLRRLPPICQAEFLEVFGNSLRRLLRNADEQIRETKDLLQIPEAKGLLVVASDGNQDLQPHDIWYVLTRLLQKKHADGRPQFSHIHALAYFNPRMLVRLPGSDQPTFLWLSGARRGDDRELKDFLGKLSQAWFIYAGRMVGHSLDMKDWNSVELENITFTGTRPQMPLIWVGDVNRTAKAKVPHDKGGLNG
jgi:hypothetical protein